ncbi:MAG: alpha/beta hydrolase fold [Herbinix sp.]|jgi:hypothetical protein|nr:alpha/beta hydrolase fold [Herbinix sp.]
MKILYYFLILLLFLVLPIQIHTTAATTKADKEYTYTVSNNSITISKYIGKNSSLNIPTMIHGKKVVAIGDNAFSDNKYLKKITIPNSITKNLFLIILP